MDWLSFVLGLINAMVWPVAALLIAFWFRREIKTLVRRIKKGKVGGAEVEFESRP